LPLLTTEIATEYAGQEILACASGVTEPQSTVLRAGFVQVYAVDGIDLPADDVDLEPELGLPNRGECRETPGTATFFLAGEWHLGRHVYCTTLD
jgi:hypothetical protein